MYEALKARLAELEKIQAENLKAWSIVSKTPDKFWAKQLKEIWSLIEETEMEIQVAKDKIAKASKEIA